ncbi:biopolymer transporter ExbD [Pararhodobacter sp. CCB-MM2]|uniref:ExbD/TolR family protein n=1 Tax=Pararhodobacter sp. CCB-MM2 TaxID=1786003 RepID=UPI000831926D|nr:biopolymer transporter ExbD [Pararhodobacter sp. CCB-MM2]MCA2014028.1 biopolymer transporter ExbD [Cereibacter sphaeroides]
MSVQSRLLRPAGRSKGEPTIGLINVVFLMLIFFLIAGSIAPSPGDGIALVRISELDVQPPPDALILTAEGTLRQGEAETDAEAYLATLEEPRVARILPDRTAPASALVELAGALRAGGAERVVILGERGEP